MVNVLGLDIGGANTKAAYITTQNGTITSVRSTLQYFPFWKRDSTQLRNMLSAIKKIVARSEMPDCIAVTITAELSDAYRTKREGITHILDCITQTFPSVPIRVLDVDAQLRTVESARANPLAVAAANWAATGWLVSQKLSDCVVVDVGSTSTSIIPVANGKVTAHGKTDLDKLMLGELVYTGTLRTNVAAIVQMVPLRGGFVRVASELFAQSGDVHLILGNLSEADYTSETADGKGKTVEDASVRLAHVVCADIETLTPEEIRSIARYVYLQQVQQIAQGLNQVYNTLPNSAKQHVPTVITGLGRTVLAKKAAQQIGVSKILDITALLADTALASPAVGVALMAATEHGGTIKWMR
jgi:probable H4MPT-linked C1 transfer pathway protein